MPFSSIVSGLGSILSGPIGTIGGQVAGRFVSDYFAGRELDRQVEAIERLRRTVPQSQPPSQPYRPPSQPYRVPQFRLPSQQRRQGWPSRPRYYQPAYYQPPPAYYAPPPAYYAPPPAYYPPPPAYYQPPPAYYAPRGPHLYYA